MQLSQLLDTEFYSWSSTSFGRGKRSVVVVSGVYILEHIPTGRFIISTSKSVSNDVNNDLQKLRMFNHPVNFLNSLCKLDGDIKIYEIPFKKASEQKAFIAKVKSFIYPKYLILN